VSEIVLIQEDGHKVEEGPLKRTKPNVVLSRNDKHGVNWR